MKLNACINLYNDRMFLGACLESLVDAVDRIIVVDGAYGLYYDHFKAFDAQARPWSTDGSLELIRGFRGLPELLILYPPVSKSGGDYECWENQAVKRSRLVDEVPEGDWFLIIDADEMLLGDFQEAMELVYESGCICASMPFYSPGTHTDRVKTRWHPRVFEKVGGMHYKGTHWHLRDRFGRIIEEKYPIFQTDVAGLAHFKSFKSQSRLIPHQNYMASLSEMGWLEPTDLGRVLMKDEP